MLCSLTLNVFYQSIYADAEKNPNDASKQVIKQQVINYCAQLRTALHNTFRYGQGTRDMSGPSGLTTEEFIAKVAWRLKRYLARQYDDAPPPALHEPDRKFRRNYDVDEEAVNKMFQSYDSNNDGFIEYEEFKRMVVKMNLAPKRKSAKGQDPDV
jgi:isocitrate dehydrogenase